MNRRPFGKLMALSKARVAGRIEGDAETQRKTLPLPGGGEGEGTKPGDPDFSGMRLALAAARRAAARDEVPVGAVLYLGGKPIASAGNRTKRSLDPSLHAEMIVLRKAAKKLGRWRLTDATLYSTAEPCVHCAAACVLFRVGRVVYGCPEPKFGGVESRLRVFGAGLNHSPEVRGGVLAEQAATLLKQFFRARRKRSLSLRERGG